MRGLLPALAAAALLGTAFPLSAQVNARICVSADELKTLCGTSNVKIVFINKGSLYYIDFSRTDPSIERIAAVQNGIAPVISPDGKKIAYAVTGGSAEFGVAAGSAWLCDLAADAKPVKVAEPAFVPRFVPGGIPKTTLLYSTCGKKAAGVSCFWDGCGKMVERDVTDGVPGPENVFWAGGSYFGGISRDKRYLSTAEASPCAFILDRQHASGKPDTVHIFTVKKLSSGADTTVSIQTCNCSGSPSGVFPGAVLYLDFSSAAFAAAGCAPPPGLGSWGFHTRLFITRNDKKILRFFDIPTNGLASGPPVGAGEAVGRLWSDPEWSSHPYFAAASVQVDRLWRTGAWEHTYNNEILYLVNLKDSSYHAVVETADSSRTSTTNMRWPWLWIETPASFAEDSSWLLHGAAAGYGQTLKHVSGGIRYNGRTIVCDGSIETLRLFSLQGRLAATLKFDNGPVRSVTLSDKTLPVPCGLYCLRIAWNERGIRRLGHVLFSR